MSPSAPPSRKVLLAGATGLVGGLLLRGLLADTTVSDVYAPVRRTLAVSHPKLHTQPVDFSALPAFGPLDEAYLALGTTIKVAGSQQAFRAVDFEASLPVAGAITPVPGGVGPVTIATLLKQTVESAEKRATRSS